MTCSPAQILKEIDDSKPVYRLLVNFLESIIFHAQTEEDLDHFTYLSNILALVASRDAVPQEAAILCEPLLLRNQSRIGHSSASQFYELLCLLYGPLQAESEDSDNSETESISSADHNNDVPTNGLSMYKNAVDDELHRLVETRKVKASLICNVVESLRENDSYDFAKGYRYSPSPFLLSAMTHAFGHKMAQEAMERLLTAPGTYAPLIGDALHAYLLVIGKWDPPRERAELEKLLSSLTLIPSRDAEAGAKLFNRALVESPLLATCDIVPGYSRDASTATLDACEVPWSLSFDLKYLLFDALMRRASSSSAIRFHRLPVRVLRPLPPTAISPAVVGSERSSMVASIEQFIEGFLTIVAEPAESPLHVSHEQLDPFVRFFRNFYLMALLGAELQDIYHEFYRPLDAKDELKTPKDQSTNMMEQLFKSLQPRPSPPYSSEIISGRLERLIVSWNDLTSNATWNLKEMLSCEASKKRRPRTHRSTLTIDSSFESSGIFLILDARCDVLKFYRDKKTDTLQTVKSI
eukprot:GHVH01017419.1.p1 GENE.GHVH01017419.1~~GHVH01017419.1.p1  ORF type:complete len:523 (-),score=84.05 GHVH01017419.1:66-1634(-)